MSLLLFTFPRTIHDYVFVAEFRTYIHETAMFGDRVSNPELSTRHVCVVTVFTMHGYLLVTIGSGNCSGATGCGGVIVWGGGSRTDRFQVQQFLIDFT